MVRAIGIVIAAVLLACAAEMRTIEPKDLGAQFRAGAKPAVAYVGFAVMYKKHIPAAVFAGPAARAEGLATLRSAVAGIPRSRELIVYCGCCPWEMCPNIKPALEELKKMGFKNVKALMIETNFASDWIDAGYPVEERAAK
jgi:rhodanese-related sulfurtransferase